VSVVVVSRPVVCEFSGFFFAGLCDWNPLCFVCAGCIYSDMVGLRVC